MEIKTAEEMFMDVQEEECPNVNNLTLSEDWQLKAMIEFAKQFIDLAAEKAFIEPMGMMTRVDKQSILGIKQIIK